MIQVNVCLIPRPHPRGESMVMFGNLSGFINFWGEFSIHQSHCRTHHLWLQHWKPLATSACTMTAVFWHWKKISYTSVLNCKPWILIKPKISAKCHLVGGVLARDNFMNLMDASYGNILLCLLQFRLLQSRLLLFRLLNIFTFICFYLQHCY